MHCFAPRSCLVQLVGCVGHCLTGCTGLCLHCVGVLCAVAVIHVCVFSHSALGGLRLTARARFLHAAVGSLEAGLVGRCASRDVIAQHPLQGILPHVRVSEIR